MQGAVDDAFQVAGPWRARVDPVVDVDPRLRRAVAGVHGEPVAAIPHGNAFRAVEGGEVVVGHLPHHAVHLGTVNGSTVATPRSLISQSWSASVAGRGLTAPGHRRAICRTHRFDP